MADSKLTVAQVLRAIPSGGVSQIPLIGGILSKLMDLTDRSTADELGKLRTTLEVIRVKQSGHGRLLDAITDALPEVPQVCRSNLELLQYALEHPDSPPEEFSRRLQAFFAKFRDMEALVEEAKSLLETHGKRLDCCETRIGKLEHGESVPNAQMLKLVELARQDEREKAEPAIAQLSQELGMTEDLIRTFLTELGEKEVPPERWPDKLMESARELKEFRKKVADDPDRRVRDAIDAGDLELADELLAKRSAEHDAQKSITLERRAELARLRLKYHQAAELYAQAAELSTDDFKRQFALRHEQASVLDDQGREFGDNDALRQAVDLYRDLIAQVSRGRMPLDWARTQNNLGTALDTIGERESGTARLEEAVAAFRLALKEYKQDRVPLDWAMTQNNLGNALCAIGERESGTARLEEAVAACRLALEERTRKRVPLNWAMTQNNLGNALVRLGERESGTARLEEAVTAYRLALEEYTRKRVPLDWAATQNNLGSALCAIGERESGTARLEEAVTAYRLALEEYTRKRVPLDWAMTQNNLGTALDTIGERASDTSRLKEAVKAYRLALKERTRDRVPLDWAMTQNNLGNALLTIGKRESGTARLEEAVAAYRLALKVFEAGGAEHYASIARDNLARAIELIRKRGGDASES